MRGSPLIAHVGSRSTSTVSGGRRIRPAGARAGWCRACSGSRARVLAASLWLAAQERPTHATFSPMLMFVHSVYFWLRDDLTPAARATFVDGVRSLTTIETVQHGFLGTPASTNREIIDQTYSYALV